MLATVLMPLAAAGCTGTVADPNVLAPGVLALQLQPSAAVELLSLTYTATRHGYYRTGTMTPMSGIAFSFEIDAVPPAADYALAIDADALVVARGTHTHCTGKTTFGIQSAQSTALAIGLQCDGVPSSSAQTSSGGNQCPVLDALRALPGTAAIGQSVVLKVDAVDPDHGPKPLAYAWSTAMGVLVSPTMEMTAFQCNQAGVARITAQVSDGDPLCANASSTVDVVCTDPNCQMPNGCTVPATSSSSSGADASVGVAGSVGGVAAADGGGGAAALAGSMAAGTGGGGATGSSAPSTTDPNGSGNAGAPSLANPAWWIPGDAFKNDPPPTIAGQSGANAGAGGQAPSSSAAGASESAAGANGAGNGGAGAPAETGGAAQPEAGTTGDLTGETPRSQKPDPGRGRNPFHRERAGSDAAPGEGGAGATGLADAGAGGITAVGAGGVSGDDALGLDQGGADASSGAGGAGVSAQAGAGAGGADGTEEGAGSGGGADAGAGGETGSISITFGSDPAGNGG